MAKEILYILGTKEAFWTIMILFTSGCGIFLLYLIITSMVADYRAKKLDEAFRQKVKEQFGVIDDNTQ